MAAAGGLMSGLGSMMRLGHQENPFIRAHTKSPVTFPFFDDGAVAAARDPAVDVVFGVVDAVFVEVDFVIEGVSSAGVVVVVDAVEVTSGVGASVDSAGRSSFFAFSFSVAASTAGFAGVVAAVVVVDSIDSIFASISISISVDV